MNQLIKKTLCLGIVLMLFTKAFAQQGEKTIVYKLPKIVDSLINVYLKTEIKQEKKIDVSNDFYILINEVRDTTSLMVCKRIKTDNTFDALIQRSNRSVKLKTWSLPVLLGEDLSLSTEYSAFDFPDDGGPITRHALMISGQLIEFYFSRNEVTLMNYSYFQP